MAGPDLPTLNLCFCHRRNLRSVGAILGLQELTYVCDSTKERSEGLGKLGRYDPYARVLTEERYDHVGMRAARRAAVESCRRAAHWGLLLGTLGRQGNSRLLEHLQASLQRHAISHTVVCPPPPFRPLRRDGKGSLDV
jgi:2-(3-amino-3-carboxypropyl)histidine synthase